MSDRLLACSPTRDGQIPGLAVGTHQGNTDLFQKLHLSSREEEAHLNMGEIAAIVEVLERTPALTFLRRLSRSRTC